MRPTQILLLCGVLAAGCQRGTESPSSASASASPTATAPAAAEKVGALARVRGNWSVVLSPKQEKDLRTMRLVFDAAEPTAEQLASLAPDERATIMSVREARKSAPADDPRYAQMRAVLDGMGRSTLVVDTSSLTITVGEVRQAAAFVVQAETSTSVKLTASTPAGRQEEVELVLGADGTLRMSKPNQPDALTFRRAAN